MAFEALLRLANSSKAERLKDAIALLLGRTERLDEWADQFYAARSRVAHEGPVQDPYFYIPTHRQTKQSGGVLWLTDALRPSDLAALLGHGILEVRHRQTL